MPLNNHTYYSLHFGTYSEEELLKQAQSYGYKSIALTDVNNTSACLNFIRLAPKYNIKPIVGIDFRNQAKQQFVGIAKNNQGFLALNQFLSHHLHKQLPIPDQAPEFENAFIIYPFERVLELNKTQFKPNELIGIQWQELKKIRFSKLFQQKEKFVIQQPVTFRNQRDFNLHRLLRAIDLNTLLSKLPKEQQAKATSVMLPYSQLIEQFKAFPFIIQNTKQIVEECNIHFNFSNNKKNQNKKHFYATKSQDLSKIKQLCQEGLTQRYAKITPQIESRVQKELTLIQQMEFVPFFLINWDIIQYAKSKNYYHVGRGSGANSIVAYLLGITNVDPIALDLYFERFMNLYRSTPPDFDIDFSWQDREDVTQYIFNKHGKKGQVALLATYNTFQTKAAKRELGKVFGLPKHEIDLLSSGKYKVENLDKLSLLTHRYAEYLNGFPNYLSVHAGGILISEKPIQYFSATNLPPKNFPTTQFDMMIAEDVGLYKYDILAQRGLGKIKDAVQIIQQNQPNAPKFNIHNTKAFMADSKIKQMLRQAKSVGCFYVESPAMRMLLKKLEVDDYLGLVAASSIIRPGVAKSGMMKEYILRHKNPERRKQAHPILWSILKETYGVMVYQEDVIKVAHYFAGLTLAEADVLRRGMSGKYRSREEFQQVKSKFFKNCKQNGESTKTIERIWQQIESFAGYAFAKGHSASYAVESYQSLYLKCYFPLEYMVATINNGGGFYSAELYLQEAKKLGARLHAPHINQSKIKTSIQGKDIYLGFHFLSGLEQQLAKRIVWERKQNGAYQSLDDFLNRIQIGISQLDVLIRINAFRFTNKNKRNLLWNARIQLNQQQKIKQNLLFTTNRKQFQIPTFQSHTLEHMFDELEILGFTLQDPFNLLQKQPENSLQAKEIKHYVNQNITIYGRLVSLKNTKTQGGQKMSFGTFLDKLGDWIDTVHFPIIIKRYPFLGFGIYKLYGKVINDFGFLYLEILQMQKMAYVQDQRFAIQ